MDKKPTILRSPSKTAYISGVHFSGKLCKSSDRNAFRRPVSSRLKIISLISRCRNRRSQKMYQEKNLEFIVKRKKH